MYETDKYDILKHIIISYKGEKRNPTVTRDKTEPFSNELTTN